MMADALVLDRLQEALEEPPPSISFARPLDEIDLLSDGFRNLASEIVQKSKKWLPSLRTAVARARRHPDHPTRGRDAWATLEPIFSQAIAARRDFIEEMERRIVEGERLDHPSVREALEILESILFHVRKEHHGLVDLYYLLKADADETDEETRGQGRSLTKPEDVRAHFERFL
jgi:hypothetical protein